MIWHEFADAGLGKLVGLGMSLCHLDQVVTGLPAEERLLEAVVVRLVVTEAERRRHDELLAQHHYLHNGSAVGHVLRYVAEYCGEWVAGLDPQPLTVLHLDGKVLRNADPAPPPGGCGPGPGDPTVDTPPERQEPKAEQTLTLVNLQTPP